MIPLTISRPAYNNSNLKDIDQWIMDNIKLLMEWFHAEPEPGISWKKESIHFMESQYQLEVQAEWNRNFEDKHGGAYRDQLNKERYDHQESLRDIIYDRETGIPTQGEI